MMDCPELKDQKIGHKKEFSMNQLLNLCTERYDIDMAFEDCVSIGSGVGKHGCKKLMECWGKEK